MNYQEWEGGISEEIKADSLWKMSVYRLALFIGDLGWYDATKLQQDRRTHSVSDQLYGALGSISANIAEGYSRGSSKERAHFYEYALGSARESRDWYHKSQHVLEEVVTKQRIELLVQIIRLLLTMVPQQRGHSLHEEPVAYLVNEKSVIETLAHNAPLL